MYENLIKLLEERGLTKYRLAKMSNISPQDLYTALNGYKPMYPGWRKRIAEALEIPENVLFLEREES